MPPTVLLLGGTGRTGRCVLEHLLERGVEVRAIVRSAARLPAGVGDHPGLVAVEADLLSLPGAELSRHVSGCDAVISCLGHVVSLRGVFGPPHDLVTRAVSRFCRALEASQPRRPTKFVLMSSVSVHHPGGGDPPRSLPERALLRVLRAMVPPVRDNQRAADFLGHEIGPSHSSVQWVVVRPDTLVAGGVSEYVLHESLAISLFRPERTRMANIAHFMCDLATKPDVWEAWRGKLPVIVDAPGAAAAGGGGAGDPR